MTAVEHPPAGSAVGRLPALIGYVFSACMPARRRLVLALPCATAILAGLLARTVNGTDEAAFAEVAGVAIFGLVQPLGTLVIGDAVLGAEVRAGTLPFTWLTPTRFWELVLARWLGGVAIALVSLVPAAALAAFVAGTPQHAIPVAVGVLTGSAAHVALFVLVGCITRRAAVWSLAIVFIIERLLGATLSGIAQLSPTWEGRAVYTGLADGTDAFTRKGIPEGVDAIVRLGVLTVVFLAAATWGVRRLSLTGSRD